MQEDEPKTESGKSFQASMAMSPRMEAAQSLREQACHLRAEAIQMQVRAQHYDLAAVEIESSNIPPATLALLSALSVD